MRKLNLASIYKTVALATTRERLTESHVSTPYLVFSAEVSNTGNVYIGDFNVSATNAFCELDAGQKVEFDLEEIGMKGYFDLSKIWLAVSVDTDGAYVGYLLEQDTD